ncbi:MAG: hypothetical protein AB1832_15350 [Pseudomonadota bacterium]
MNIHARRSMFALATCLLAALAGTVSARQFTPDGWLPPTLQLTGVWDVQVTLRNCTTGAALVSFPAMDLFIADGSSSEVGVGMPPAARYPSFGRWHYIGPRRFDSRFSFFRFASDQSYAGTQDVHRTIVLSLDGNHYSSTSSVAIYDTQHHLLQTGCATESAVRR